MVVAVTIAGAASSAAACGGSHHAPKTSPNTQVTAVRADDWHPPVVSGPPSTANFCTLLVAQYTHIKTNVLAVNLRVRQQIVHDYITFTPNVIAAAPPDIAPAATVYLQAIARVLGDLNAVGLNAAKAPPGQVGAVLTDPQIQAAGAQVLGYSQQYCHYDISGVT